MTCLRFSSVPSFFPLSSHILQFLCLLPPAHILHPSLSYSFVPCPPLPQMSCVSPRSCTPLMTSAPTFPFSCRCPPSSLFFKIPFSSDPLRHNYPSHPATITASFMVLFPNALSISSAAKQSNLLHRLLWARPAFPSPPPLFLLFHSFLHPPLLLLFLLLFHASSHPSPSTWPSLFLLTPRYPQ